MAGSRPETGSGITLLADEHLRLVRTHGDDVYVERSAIDRPATVFRISPGAPARPVAHLAAGRPRGVLQAIEDGTVLCLEADGTLVAFSPQDGRRAVLRRLEPTPAAVAVTPEHVVWCSADTRSLDGGGGPRVPGEVWRWWRGSAHVERLGEQPSFRPDLAVAPPRTPIPPPALAPDIFVGADDNLGVIDASGLRWLAREPQSVHELACDAEAVYYTTHGRVKRRDRQLGEVRVVWRATIPLALAIWGQRLVVGQNLVYDRGAVVEQSAIVAVDLDTGAGAVLGQDVGRPIAVAANAYGAFALEEPWTYGEGSSRVVFFPWDAPPVAVLPAVPPLDPAAWTYPPFIQWWRPDGSGGYFSLDAQGAWTCAAADPPETGTLDPAARPALLAAVQRWREDAAHAANGWADLSQHRGWLVAWGEHAWHRPAGDRASEVAQAIDDLLALLAPACPLLAAVIREGF